MLPLFAFFFRHQFHAFTADAAIIDTLPPLIFAFAFFSLAFLSFSPDSFLHVFFEQRYTMM